MTSTYYLLLKKKERVTGKNYVFEQVTFDKRKNLYSTSNLNGNFSKGLDLMSLNSTQKLGGTYAKSEGRAGAHAADIRSQGGSSVATNNYTKDDSIHKRVADIINLPSKAVTPATQSNLAANQKMAAMHQTFNTDSIRPALNSLNTTKAHSGQPSRVAQSHSPSHIVRKNLNDSQMKPHGVGLKQNLGAMKQTF